MFGSTQSAKSSRHSAARSSPASSASATCSPSLAKWRAQRSAYVRASSGTIGAFHSRSVCIQCADETKRSDASCVPVLA